MVSTLTRWKIEAKVAAATGSAAGAGILFAVLNDVENDSSLLGSLPAWAQAVVLVLVPPAAAFFGGYYTKHTPRPPAAPALVPPPAGPTDAPSA
jgi:hypothetical protein